ncbi:type I DNA topoisomerase [Rhodovibrio salinarum]|uniref:DNA topoisomerase 1 n=1 Tax=Rhodovibrio salinarum TaxID=1087 RepID=A0A934QFM7_9PROT|nr:type I DNA topoisomerase [Rhodovibrio salinarum]MBK1695675.1 DNA topoisomerase I [Rhodovibrio salinarum]
MNVVIVESPAKARTINKYLGRDFHVLASYGHVRDLPSKDGSVRPDSDFEMDWEVDSQAEKRIKEIASAVKGADALYLATDPDREGEAISWHILEELRRRRVLGENLAIRRVAFNAITKSAIQEAFEQPRDLNRELIEAYLARRALDYLVGFTLSPVLWRKLPGSKSAGRVQSVALRLICEREAEIEAFRPQEYWTIDAHLTAQQGGQFTARLTHLDGQRLDKFGLPNAQSAEAAKAKLENANDFKVAGVERKQSKRNPQPPFTTSTLQQEASRKLGFGASRTMQVAQRLYEGVEMNGEAVGLITYMRTDGVQISQEALTQTRDLVNRRFGSDYLPDKPRQYATKAKNAQEAHEAIRPTDLFRTPEDVRSVLNDEAYKLYELVWKRTVASQMESARLDQVQATIRVDYDLAQLRANGSTVTFDGFYRLYRESRDEESESSDRSGTEDDKRLPPLKEGEPTQRDKIVEEQHFTQPPPRYSEASLVRRLEELGIGRPSTYASILQVLQDRQYVKLDKRRFVPEDRGRLVTAFLSSFFDRYVEYDFTAKLEQQLDDISGGKADWKQVLRDFWEQFKTEVDRTKGLKMADVIDALDEELGPHFFPADPNDETHEPRTCPNCGGRLGLKIGRTGGFIGCGNYPECKYTRPLIAPAPGEAPPEGDTGPKELGAEPDTGESITLKKGPYGPYIQLGEAQKGKKPKRVSLPKDYDPAELTLHRALKLLELPREVCKHPSDGEPILAGIGRYGPYVKHGSTYVSLGPDDDVLEIGQNRAVTLIDESPKKKRQSNQIQLGEHPREGGAVTAGQGRFGPYVKHGRLYASLPKGTEPESATLEQAIPLLDEQAAKKGKGGKSTSTAKSGTAKSGTSKSGTGKSGTGKTAAGKTGSTKSATKSSASKNTTRKTTSKKTSSSKSSASTGTTAASGSDAADSSSNQS